ncbi:hypothetical protein F4679DRAFT_521733 [Xylaria curta]|nr:hypothetical protein F4679DRAFT_521733 [Xylaria curta]
MAPIHIMLIFSSFLTAPRISVLQAECIFVRRRTPCINQFLSSNDYLQAACVKAVLMPTGSLGDPRYLQMPRGLPFAINAPCECLRSPR